MGSFLLENENNFKIESLDTEKKVADEYLTKEETEAKFKTKKRRNRPKNLQKRNQLKLVKLIQMKLIQHKIH